MMYANLHLHSTYSDAGFSPEQLVYVGKALGYRALALTDHETDGGWQEFQYVAKRNGILPVLGAEFYGNFQHKCLHLTALDYDYNDPGIRALIRRCCAALTEWTRRRFERALDNGWIHGITWEQILSLSGPDTWICHDTVQLAAKTLRVVPLDFNWADFREKTWKAPEVRSWKIPYPSAEEVISTVRNAGGVIALAHPEGWMDMVEKLVPLGLNGIEVNHPDLSEQTARAAEQAAKDFRLYRCGGTDHSGPMSCCGGKYAYPAYHGVSEEDLNILLERRLD